MYQSTAISFDQIRQLSPDKVVGDRPLQERIWRTVEFSTHRRDHVSDDFPYNQNPTGGIGNNVTFVIADREHIYFFPSWVPGPTFPKVLADEDMSVTTANGGKKEFEHLLCRVRTSGGVPEIYSSIEGRWINGGELGAGLLAEYKPSVLDRMREILNYNLPKVHKALSYHLPNARDAVTNKVDDLTTSLVYKMFDGIDWIVERMRRPPKTRQLSL